MRFGMPTAKREPVLKDRGFNYRRDKSGWVTFLNGKKKKKLRTHITFLAQLLTKNGKVTVRENRELLIEYYNKDGMKGISRVFKVKINEMFN